MIASAYPTCNKMPPDLQVGALVLYSLARSSVMICFRFFVFLVAWRSDLLNDLWMWAMFKMPLNWLCSMVALLEVELGEAVMDEANDDGPVVSSS